MKGKRSTRALTSYNKKNIVKSKRSQFKIQQMAFMLIAVVLFFILAGLLFLSVFYGGIRKEATESKQEKALVLISKIADSPEFSCYEESISCVDADKVLSLKEIPAYKDFWPVESIVIKKIYPAGKDIECTKTNYPNCNTIKLFTKENIAPISTFVALCRKEKAESGIYDKCELAILMVGIKSE